MQVKDINIDGGQPFDWGKTSSDYAKYRDIYPDELYKYIIDRKLCVNGQKVLDIGTGTGVLPRNMYAYGGQWTGVDIQPNQIEQARKLSEGMDITYLTGAVEDMKFSESTFDVITACQCFWYFDHNKAAPIFDKILKKDGKILVLYMAWLPFEDEIAEVSEKLILKYNPKWSGAGETVHPIVIPDIYNKKFELCCHKEFKVDIPFTRESWNGRMKACRGVGASMNENQIRGWEREHMSLLKKTADNEFSVLHYVALAELKKKQSDYK